MYTLEQACRDYDLIVEQLGAETALFELFQMFSIDDSQFYFNEIINSYDLRESEDY